MNTTPSHTAAGGQQGPTGASPALSLSGAEPLGGAQRPDSAFVSVTSETNLSRLPELVSVLVKLGHSATVRLRSGNKESLQSAVTMLNERAVIKSATLSLAGRESLS